MGRYIKCDRIPCMHAHRMILAILDVLCSCRGGYIKRDGRPKDGDVLVSRLVDRPLRPLFKEGWANETQARACMS